MVHSQSVTESPKTNISKETAMRSFLLDIHCLDELSQWSTKCNIFDVLKLARTEIRHSNMLAWLMDANESHGLSDLFIRELINPFVKDSLSWLMLDYNTCTIRREWKNIDLLIVSEAEKKIVVIENKIDSSEHSNQLARYQTIIQNDKIFKDYDTLYLFLTPDGKKSSIPDVWKVLDYKTLIEKLAMAREKCDPPMVAQVLIDNYIELIRRTIVEDTELIEICQKIYKKHRVALDLIFEYRPDELSEIRDVITTAMQDDHSLYILSGQRSKNRIVFHSKIIDHLLTSKMYGLYVFLENGKGKDSGKIIIDLYLFLESSDVDPNHFVHMENLTQIFGAKNTKTTFTQKALAHHKMQIDMTANSVSEQMDKVANTILKYCHDMENKIVTSGIYKNMDFTAK